MEDINLFLEQKVGKSLLYNKIYPYNYTPQPSELMEDVRDYGNWFNQLICYYRNNFTYEHFIYDLCLFYAQWSRFKHNKIDHYKNDLEFWKSIGVDDTNEGQPNWFRIQARMIQYKLEISNIRVLKNNYLIFQHWHPWINKRAYNPVHFKNRNVYSKDLINACRKWVAMMLPMERWIFMQTCMNRRISTFELDRYMLSSINTNPPEPKFSGYFQDYMFESHEPLKSTIRDCDRDSTTSLIHHCIVTNQEMGELSDAEDLVIMDGGPNYWDSTSDY